jgi:hypothetical protein
MYLRRCRSTAARVFPTRPWKDGCDQEMINQGVCRAVTLVSRRGSTSIAPLLLEVGWFHA